MTKLSLVFFIPLVLILIFRIATFSPVPIAEGCEIKSSWNLNRIENFSGFEPEILVDKENLYFFDNKGSILKFNKNSKLQWKKNYYSKKTRSLYNSKCR